MKIKTILKQNRRDFVAIYECEHCGNKVERSGYDDSYFHENVIPAMKCEECGKTSPDSYEAKKTKFLDCEVV